MSANKIEIFLGFKPSLEGLNKFTSALENRLEKVREFNRSIENGAAAVNSLLSQAATVVGGARIVGFFSGAVKQGVEFNAMLEQSKLGIAAVLKQFDESGAIKSFDQAITLAGQAIELLKQKAVTSPASFASLVQAFQGTVGAMTAAGIPLKKQVELIVNMSQALAGLGIREEQILQETRALITGNINADAAAAKILGITAADITAAKQKGQLYEFLSGKIAAFAEAGERGANSLNTLRSNFGDLLEQRAAAATERLADAFKALYARLTELVGSRVFANVLGSIADRAETVVQGLASMAAGIADLGPLASSAIGALTSELGRVAIILGTILVAGVAMRGLFGGLLLVVNPLRSAFVALAGVSFAALVRDVQMFSRELGILKTMTLANWGQRLGTGLIAVGAIAAGVEIGLFLDKLQVGELTVGGWVERVTNAFLFMASYVEFAARLAWIGLKYGFLEKLEEGKLLVAKFAQGSAIALSGMFHMPVVGAGLAGLGEKVAAYEERVKAIENERNAETAKALKGLWDDTGIYAANDDYIRRKNAPGAEEAARQQSQQAQVQRELAAARAKEQDARLARQREELTLKRALFDLDTAIVEAQTDGKQGLVEKLTRERDELKLRQELLDSAVDDATAHVETLELIRARLDVEAELRERERAWQEEERTLSEQLAAHAQKRTEAEQDRLSTEEQKQQRIVALLREENRLIDERIQLLESRIPNVDVETAASLRDKIDQLQQQRARNVGEIDKSTPLGVTAQVGADLTEYVDSFGTRSEVIARIWSGPIKSGLEGARTVMNKLLGTTEYWQEKLGTIGGSVVGALTSAISDMWAQWVAGQIQSFVLEKIFRQQRKAEVTSEIALNTTNAALSSISSWGTAALVGAAALVAAMAAFGGFETGGYTYGQRGRVAGFVHGEEFVFNAEAVDAIGRDYLEEMRSSATSGSGSRSQAGTQRSDAGATAVTVAFVNHRTEQRRFQQMEGNKASYDFNLRRTRRS